MIANGTTSSSARRAEGPTSRRGFLSNAAATGVFFCSCGLLDAARAQANAVGRKPLLLCGQRVKTIDVHAHCNFREVIPMLGGNSSPLLPPVPGAQEAFISVEQRFRAMDAQGVDMEVLSINPFWYAMDVEIARQIVKVQNEKLAELCEANKERFAAFASLTLQAPELAVQELEFAVKKQGLKGAAIGGVVAGTEFSDGKFHPVWAKAEELGAVLFIHPQGIPELGLRVKGNGWLGNAVVNPLETTLALSHLIFEGTLDRFPKLRVLAAHGGGYLPFYPDRTDHGCLVAPNNCDKSSVLKKKPSEYLKQIYFDSLVFKPEAVRRLVDQVGVEQVVLGSDYPYPWALKPVELLLESEKFTDAEKRAILSANAAKLLAL